MPPHFELLQKLIRILDGDLGLEFVRVVLAAPEGGGLFVEVAEPDFRTELQEALRQGYRALGLLGWEVGSGTVQAKSILFPWLEGEASALPMFQRLCEEAVESVRDEMDRQAKR